jgi:hypothetical protein
MRHRRISLLHLHGTLGRLMGKRATALLGFGIASILAVALAMALVLREDGPDHPETVIVPGSNATDLQMRFDLMRSRGLRVAIPERMHFYPTSSPEVRSQSPGSESRVKWGSIVTLHLWPGSFGTPIGPKRLPTYRVPDFMGKQLADAVDWTEGKWVYWTADLPPLPASNAKHLFDAYVVTSQRPAAGSYVRLAIPARVVGRKGVRLTPVELNVALSH